MFALPVRMQDESIFTRQLFRFDLPHQGPIFDQIAELAKAGRLHAARSGERPWTLENLREGQREGQRALESRRTLATIALPLAECVQSSAPLGRDVQLATGSWLRAAEDAARAADERQSDRNRAEQRENKAARERNLAGEARDRQAEAAERQRKSLEQLHQAVVLCARVLLDPSDSNHARLQTFLNLLCQAAPEDLDL